MIQLHTVHSRLRKIMNFFSAYDQGFVRIAACTPQCAPADPDFNVAEILKLARQGASDHVALMVFPELAISGYAIDDLLLQAALLDRVNEALGQLVIASRALSPVLLVGAPLRRDGRLYNCAVAIHGGRILGVTPKGHLPNYREFYEKRWFASGRDMRGTSIEVVGNSVPFGMDLIFAAEDVEGFVFHMELCEDLWAPAPPSDFAALAGARILTNLSASNITVAKAATRRLLCATQSVRCWSAYVYSAAGPGESTTDLAWDGQASIHELGTLLAETDRFPLESQMAIADVDVDRLGLERLRTGTFNEATIAHGRPEQDFRRVTFRYHPPSGDVGLRRTVERFPFVPADPAHLEQDCFEAYSIQVQGLMKRMQATGLRQVCIGVSGGLDSTHALIVAVRAFDRLGWPRSGILGFTMPGFGTSDTTKSDAWALMRALGVTAEEVDIKPLARQLLADLRHPFAAGTLLYDVTFENVQAGLRTDFLFRAANQRGALVLGTGDLSEVALGWSTYGVGEQMSHYNVNTSVPKTLMQHLVRWVTRTEIFPTETNEILLSILDRVISPELVPPLSGSPVQSTEELIGPYELHDFTLFYLTRYGLRPSKIVYLAHHAWRNADMGVWPPAFPLDRRHEYSLEEIESWAEVFITRFFANQFKRSASPNGPKVTAGGSLSPRGDWRAPSDASGSVWLEELRLNVPGTS